MKTNRGITKTALAAALKLSKARITQLVKEGLPVLPGGLVDRAAAVAWYRAHKSNHGMKPGPTDGEPSNDSADLLAARARKEQALAGRYELELAQKRGELVSAADVRTAWGEMVNHTRSRILLLPSKLAPKVAMLSDPREVQMAIDREVRQLLTSLTEYRPKEDAA